MISNPCRSAVFILAVVAVSSCSTMTLDSDVPKTPSSESGTHIQHGSFYNFIWSEPPAEKCGSGRGFSRIRYHTNAIYSLVSILSLGLYIPQTVEWWCDGNTDGGDEEEYIPE